MSATVINYGRSRMFPTCIGNFYLQRRQEYPIDNPQAARELSEFPQVVVKGLKPEKPPIDYSKYPVLHLRQIAATLGIKKVSSMKKADLIKALSTGEKKK